MQPSSSQGLKQCPQCGTQTDASEAICHQCHYNHEEDDGFKGNAPIEKIVFTALVLGFVLVGLILYVYFISPYLFYFLIPIGVIGVVLTVLFLLIRPKSHTGHHP
jgi:Na+/H+ antiporter NhaD/arsenite permease-like protein